MIRINADDLSEAKMDRTQDETIKTVLSQSAGMDAEHETLAEALDKSSRHSASGGSCGSSPPRGTRVLKGGSWKAKAGLGRLVGRVLSSVDTSR